MKRGRIVAGVLVAGLVLAAIWVAGMSGRTATQSTSDTEVAGAYDYEAHEVVVQQMDANGQLQYEVEARHVAQLPRDGRIAATDLTLHRDPPGTIPGGEHRWTLTAKTAQLPTEGDVVTLQGEVRAQGRPENSRVLLVLTTGQLEFDLAKQQLASDQTVNLTWGRNTLQGSRLRANIKTGDVALESQVNGTLVP